MVTLNFGPSHYARYYPGHTRADWKERIIIIPEKSCFLSTVSPDKGYYKLSEAKPRKMDLLSYINLEEEKWEGLPGVEFPIKDSIGNPLHSYNIHLVWIKGRGEWVAIKTEVWAEEGNFSEEEEHGPYCLDEYCKQALAQAYGFSLERLPENLEKIAPLELEQIVNESKILELHSEKEIAEFVKEELQNEDPLLCHIKYLEVLKWIEIYEEYKKDYDVSALVRVEVVRQLGNFSKTYPSNSSQIQELAKQFLKALGSIKELEENSKND